MYALMFGLIFSLCLALSNFIVPYLFWRSLDYVKRGDSVGEVEEVAEGCGQLKQRRGGHGAYNPLFSVSSQ